MKTEAFDKLSNEYDGIGLAVEHKTLEQFRTEIVDTIYKAIRRETTRSASFTRRADYFRAKLAEAKIEGLHIALGAIIDAATIEVKEETK